MAHSCPECGSACYCGGDIDDCLLDFDEDVEACTHCDGADEPEGFDDDYLIDGDERPTMPKRKIYVASSWRNPIQQDIVAALRSAGHEVYDFRNPAPGNKGFAWSDVNPNWLQWTPEQFVTDLYSGHPSVVRGYGYDKAALDWCDTCVLVLPCGRSAHLEAGYAAGQGKLTLFYLHPDKFEPELMYLLGDNCVTTVNDLLAQLEGSGDGN